MNEKDFFVCPVCRMHKRVSKNIKGMIRFEYNLDNEPLIIIRQGGGGYKDSFPIIQKITLKELKENKVYSELYTEFKKHIEYIHGKLQE